MFQFVRLFVGRIDVGYGQRMMYIRYKSVRTYEEGKEKGGETCKERMKWKRKRVVCVILRDMCMSSDELRWYTKRDEMRWDVTVSDVTIWNDTCTCRVDRSTGCVPLKLSRNPRWTPETVRVSTYVCEKVRVWVSTCVRTCVRAKKISYVFMYEC